MGVHLDGFRGGDRTAIELPAVQDRLLQALKATGRPVVFVMCSGSAVAMPWAAENCDAVLTAFYPGEAGGTAIADVLAGDCNPSGRLPVTFYASTSDLPDFEDYYMDNRTYRYFEGKPLFPFGHGLGYSEFSYGDATIKPLADGGEAVAVLNVPVTNAGQMDGDEIVQVYVRNLQDPYGPKKSLRAFRRVATRAGETVGVEFALPSAAFEFFDREEEVMKVKPGDYEILYGGTSDDALLKKLSFTLKK